MLYLMKNIPLLFLFVFIFPFSIIGQERAVQLSISSFYADEKPLTSKEYKDENFDDVHPGDPNGFLSRGVDKLNAGHHFEALKDFNESIEIVPECGPCYYYRGINYLMMDSVAQAKKDYHQSIYHDVLLIESYNDLSGIYIQEKNLDSAEIILKKGMEHYPSYLPSYFNMGYLKLLQGKKNKALKSFDKCLSMDECHMESASMKALVYTWTGKYKEAETELDKVGKCEEVIPEIHLWNAVVKLRRKKINEAVVEMNKALELEDNYLYYYLRGLLNTEREEYSLAVGDIMKSYELNPLESKDHKGSYEYRKTQLDFQGIFRVFSQLKENYKQSEVNLFEKILCSLVSEEYSKAESELNKLIKKDKKNHFAYFLLGFSKDKSYRFKDAFAYYNKSLQLYNGNPEVYKRRGLLHQGDNELDEAMADFTTMYEIDPTSSEALKYRGIAKMLKKQYDLALEDFREYESKFESDTDIFFNKGQCQNQFGEYENAMVSFEQVLAINPVDIEVLYKIAENSYILGNSEKCISMCDSILNNKDCYVMASNLKGVVQMNTLKHESALETFEKGLDCSPNYTDIEVNRSIVLVNLGRNQDALNQINHVIALAPYSGFAYLVRAQIKYNLKIDTACRDLFKAMELGVDVSEEDKKLICP